MFYANENNIGLTGRFFGFPRTKSGFYSMNILVEFDCCIFLEPSLISVRVFLFPYFSMVTFLGGIFNSDF